MKSRFWILGIALAAWPLACGGESRRRMASPPAASGGALGGTSGTNGFRGGTAGAFGGSGAGGSGIDASVAGTGGTAGTPVDASAAAAPATGGVGDGGSPAGGDAGSGEETCSQEACATGEVYNPWIRACQPANLACPPPGQDNGGPCTTDAECRSSASAVPYREVCIRENLADYCSSYCIAPADFGAADSFVRGDCPQGSLCFRYSQYTSGEGFDRCVPECREDSECRTADGYYCRRTFGGRLYGNGYCAPAHCVSRGCFGYGCGC